MLLVLVLTMEIGWSNELSCPIVIRELTQDDGYILLTVLRQISKKWRNIRKHYRMIQ